MGEPVPARGFPGLTASTPPAPGALSLPSARPPAWHLPPATRFRQTHMQQGPSKYEFEGPCCQSGSCVAGFPTPPRGASRLGRPPSPGASTPPAPRSAPCVRPVSTQVFRVWPGRPPVVEPTRTLRCVERFLLQEIKQPQRVWPKFFRKCGRSGHMSFTASHEHQRGAQLASRCAPVTPCAYPHSAQMTTSQRRSLQHDLELLGMAAGACCPGILDADG